MSDLARPAEYLRAGTIGRWRAGSVQGLGPGSSPRAGRRRPRRTARGGSTGWPKDGGRQPTRRQ